LHGFPHRELLRELGLLEGYTEPLTELVIVAVPGTAKDDHLTGVRCVETFADLDGRGLPGSVRTEQAKTLASEDLEVEAVHCDDILIGLTETANLKRYV
jgi:hypothetical protein